MELPKEIKNEIWEYCKANNITNVDEFITSIVTRGFTSEKFGSVPWEKPAQIKEVEKIVEKEVIKEVPVEVIKEVERIVEKRVEVPIEVIKKIEVPVEKIIEKEVIKEVPVEKIIEKEVPIEVIKEIVVEKEVPVEIIKEIVVEKEVPIETIKEVEKIVEKEIYVTDDETINNLQKELESTKENHQEIIESMNADSDSNETKINCLLYTSPSPRD